MGTEGSRMTALPHDPVGSTGDGAAPGPWTENVSVNPTTPLTVSRSRQACSARETVTFEQGVALTGLNVSMSRPSSLSPRSSSGDGRDLLVTRETSQPRTAGSLNPRAR